MAKEIQHSLGDACSLGMLRTSPVLPCDGLPRWANTAAQRMKDMGIAVGRIKDIIFEMEIERRKQARAQLPGNIPRTEFDEYLADLLSRFTQSKSG